jgi:GxxExxY protein
MTNMPHLRHSAITDKILKAFYPTYNELVGFPEYIMRRGTAIALRDEGLAVEEEKKLSVWFRGHLLASFRADIVVESLVIVEIKIKPEIDPFDRAQLLHYLKATDLEVGLLLNFGRKPEFSRVVYEQRRKGPRFEPPSPTSEDHQM